MAGSADVRHHLLPVRPEGTSALPADCGARCLLPRLLPREEPSPDVRIPASLTKTKSPLIGDFWFWQLRSRGIISGANMNVVSRSCKQCGKTLYASEEKERGLCEDCRRAGGGKCVRCGAILGDTGERNAGLCRKCRAPGATCLQCGAALYGEEERAQGLCARHRRRG